MKRSYFLSFGMAAIVIAMLSISAFSAYSVDAPQTGKDTKAACCRTDCTCGETCGCKEECSGSSACCTKGCGMKAVGAKGTMKACCSDGKAKAGASAGCNAGAAVTCKSTESGKMTKTCLCIKQAKTK